MHPLITDNRANWRKPCQVQLDEISVRRGATLPWQIGVLSALVLIEVLLGGLIGDFFSWLFSRAEILLVLGGLACWRWGWFAFQSIRAIIYRYIVFPKLKRAAIESVK